MRLAIGSSLAEYAPCFYGTNVIVTAISTDAELGCRGLVAFDSSDGRHWLNVSDSHSDPLEVAISLVGTKVLWDQQHGFRYRPGKWSYELQDTVYDDPIEIPWCAK